MWRFVDTDIYDDVVMAWANPKQNRIGCRKTWLMFRFAGFFRWIIGRSHGSRHSSLTEVMEKGGAKARGKRSKGEIGRLIRRVSPRTPRPSLRRDGDDRSAESAPLPAI